MGKKIVLMNENGKIKSTFYSAIIFMLVMMVMIWPLLKSGCIHGHDVLYHLLRTESLKTSIQMGDPFVKINTLFFNNAGYASSLFYPDFMLYFPAVLRVSGFGIAASYKLFLILCIALSYASAYYCAKLITKSRYSAVVTSIVFTLSQYFIHDIYIRGAVGEITAFIFIPFLMFGIYDLYYDNFQKPWIMAVGFIGVMLCHTITLMICLFLYMIVFVVHIKTFVVKPELLKKLILTATVVLLLTAFYWAPVIEQMLSNKFVYSIPWVFVGENAVKAWSIVSAKFPGMGFIVFMLFFPRLSIRKTKENEKLLKFSDECMALGVFFALSATRLVPWDILENYINFLQFPWRLYIAASACLAVSVGILFKLYFESRKSKSFGLILVICAMITSAMMSLASSDIKYDFYNEDYFKTISNTATVGAGEWLPLAAKNTSGVLASSNIVKADTGQYLSFNRKDNAILVESSFDGIKYFDVPFIYYKGYSAVLTNNGNEMLSLKVTGNGENGFCRVELPQYAEGVVLVKYEGTFVQKSSYIISILTFLIALGFCSYKTIKSQKRSRLYSG